MCLVLSPSVDGCPYSLRKDCQVTMSIPILKFSIRKFLEVVIRRNLKIKLKFYQSFDHRPFHSTPCYFTTL